MVSYSASVELLLSTINEFGTTPATSHKKTGVQLHFCDLIHHLWDMGGGREGVVSGMIPPVCYTMHCTAWHAYVLMSTAKACLLHVACKPFQHCTACGNMPSCEAYCTRHCSQNASSAAGCYTRHTHHLVTKQTKPPCTQ
jgi:hypothetical protein